LGHTLFDAVSPELAALGIECHRGDSRRFICQMTARLADPVTWYLDAHWFWTPADKPQIPNDAPFPLWAELSAIDCRSYAAWVIVDDVNVFGKREHAWPIDPRWSVVSTERICDVLGRDRIRQVDVYGDCFIVQRMAS